MAFPTHDKRTYVNHTFRIHAAYVLFPTISAPCGPSLSKRPHTPLAPARPLPYPSLMSLFTPFRQDPHLRTAALMMVLYGACLCSIGPYLSTLGVDVFGLGNAGYAAVLVASTLLSVSTSVLVGIRADQTARRRGIMLGSVAVTVGGLALMVIAPSALSFVLAHALLMPLGAAIWGQVFAMARQAGALQGDEVRDAVMAAVRALFALPFIIVLPLWSLAFAWGAQVQWVYPVALILAAGMLALTARAWPRDGQTAWEDPKSGLTLQGALAELAQPHLVSRVFALGAVNAPMSIYIVIAGLIFASTPGRGPADTALYIGMVAGLEVPIMLALPRLTKGMSRPLLILIGTALYAMHVALMPFIAASSFVWLLVIPAAVGGSIILLFPMAYLQDLLSARPGTGASLMALQRVTGEVLAAACFAIGTLIAGYGLAAILCTMIGLAGALWLWRADTDRDVVAQHG